MWAFTAGVKIVEPLTMPYVAARLLSWFKDEVKSIGFLEQTGVVAFTVKHLLRLFEISLSLPVFEGVEAKSMLPMLMPQKFAVQGEVSAKLAEEAETLRDLRQAQQLKGVGLLELLISEEAEKLRRFLGISGEYSGEPVIIILPEEGHSLWYLFWVVCRELYREVRGSHLEPVVLLEEGEWIDQWLRFPGSFSGKVVILYEKYVRSGEREKLFKRRLQEMFSQGLGFLIVIAEDVGGAEALIRELCKPYIARITCIHAIPELDRLARMLSTGFGIPLDELRKTEGLKAEDRITIIADGRSQEFPKSDIMVARADRMYRDFLDELLSSNYLACAGRDVGERESEDHVVMKVLAIKELNEKYDVKLEKIACTSEVGDGVIADVYVEERALAIECETMLGVAPAPLLKVFESVRKYERKLSKPVDEIWVVVRNWPAILHLGELPWAESILKRELKQYNKRVKFFIPEIHRKSLQPIEDVVRTLWSMQAKPTAI
jgi:bifunctional DNA-binding transcriptional regulator/antitoxin component of YhaV-PrlF toxin-antitoxin module